jgi:hypothetical protein
MKGALSHIVLAFLLLLGACTNDQEFSLENSRGNFTLTVNSGSLTIATRATTHDGDNEYKVDSLDLFFYPGGSETEAPAYTIRHIKVNNYEGITLTRELTESQLTTLFPGDATTCTVYAVANVTGQSALSDDSTLQQLKNIALTTALTTTANEDIVFAMDALGTLELDRNTMTVHGDLTLKRALAKIVLEISVPDQMKVASGTETLIYESVKEGSKIVAELYNAATHGLLNGTVAEASKRGFTGSENPYKRTYTAIEEESTDESNASESTTSEDEEVQYRSYTHTAFYSYQNEWASDFQDQETAIKLQVPWKLQGSDSDYLTYYYQIPINFEGKQLKRNQYYHIRLKVGMLGSTVPNETVSIEGVSYDILEWGEEEFNFVNDLTKNHYLVVEENQRSLWNESEVTINYSACSTLAGVYLTDVSYYSTKYLTDGEPTLVHLYKATYNSSTNSYSNASSSAYGTYDTQVRSDFSAVKQSLENKEYTLTFEQDVENGVEIGSGVITFKADVSNFAGLVYRPLTYTIVLVLNSDHKSLRQEIQVVQYPAKYVSFGNGGDVFVDGYYGRLSTGTVKNSSTNMYQSYSFPCVYSYSNKTSGTSISNSVTYKDEVSGDHTGYYSTSSYAGIMSIDYGSSTSTSTDYVTGSSFYAMNTPYEYVRGLLDSGSKSVNFENTIDVSVSAFNSDDYQFSVLDGDDGSSNTYEYIIGNPRVAGGYTSDDTHVTTAYDRTDGRLYDYLVSSGSSGSTYYRYVHSWGDNAAKIKVGGTGTSYDNIIAPSFKIQSSYGANAGGVKFDVAQKRCATYQEAGYPAGRWRLPTMAEIAFIVYLQKSGVIDQFFIDKSISSGAYWTSSGGCVQVSSSIGDDLAIFWKDYYNSSTTRKDKGLWVRCVYDLWYWGDNPKSPTTTYYPEP